MLLSMTGYGEASGERDGWVVGVELRSVNSRYFKLNFRASDGFAGLEPRVEPLLRDRIRRGSVYVQLRVQFRDGADNYRINREVLGHYRHQLEEFARQWPDGRTPDVGSLLMLPGVVDESPGTPASLDVVWDMVASVVLDAAESLNAMRELEGAALTRDLHELATTISERLEAVALRAPAVIADYQVRLQERVNQALADLNVTVQATDLIREVSLYCDRSDISEEIVRMRSHLEQFQETLSGADSAAGRKLEFIVQEMGRETNTIGSKANDKEIAREVVEIKTALERIREQVQNVE